MTIGSWEPETQTESGSMSIDAADLQLFISLVEKGQLDQLPGVVPEAVQQKAAMMKLPKDQWLTALAPFSDLQLQQLMEFFTLAEEKISGWDAGEKNPCIWAGKLLKKRGAFPDKEEVARLKSLTRNWFIPYGNPLG
ncbi:hypothetical protein [Pelagibaculum spongiae]|uniref:Uncharacterized protein n=1 Tax=Pelagibaculum spongiae TaxID=2080658 RepID=A0A2V1GV88_9GAMM|nr:hypothetical protein [Pelagibaculum spongiae]PVZ63904.1 hypothetical protein DC094_20495 [Pelagibaculum spongiae]